MWTALLPTTPPRFHGAPTVPSRSFLAFQGAEGAGEHGETSPRAGNPCAGAGASPGEGLKDSVLMFGRGYDRGCDLWLFVVVVVVIADTEGYTSCIPQGSALRGGSGVLSTANNRAVRAKYHQSNTKATATATTCAVATAKAVFSGSRRDRPVEETGRRASCWCQTMS